MNRNADSLDPQALLHINVAHHAIDSTPDPLAKAYCKFGSDLHLLLALISRDIRLVLIYCVVVIGPLLVIRSF
jgi:hypothetical protein